MKRISLFFIASLLLWGVVGGADILQASNVSNQYGAFDSAYRLEVSKYSQLARHQAFLKESKIQNKMSSNNRMTTMGITLKIQQFTQQTDYWCGPAALQSALYSIGRGTGNDQRALASQIGTTRDGSSGYNIKEVLNRWHGQNWYVIVYPSITYRDNWETNRKMTMSLDRGLPVITGLYGKLPNFNYWIRHFVTFYAYYDISGVRYYYYVDPAGGRQHSYRYGRMSVTDLSYFMADGSIIY